MSTEAIAIIGLAFWIWSHEAQHSYERRKSNWVLIRWMVLSLVSAVLLGYAGIHALGIVR